MAREFTNRKKHAMETKKKIVEAARKAILEKGFEGVSVNDIAKEAGVATGSFYTYFKRKEDVINEFKTDFERLAEMVNQMEDKTIFERLEHYCRVFMKVNETEGLEICRQWIKNKISADAGSGEQETLVMEHRAVQMVLEKAVEEGQLREETPVEELAYQINSELYGMLLVWCMSDGKMTGSSHTKRYCKMMLEKSLGLYRNI